MQRVAALSSAYPMLPTALFVPSTARHGPFFSPDETTKRRHRQILAAAAIIMNRSGSFPPDGGVDDHAHQLRSAPLRSALLISDSSDVASTARGEGLAGILASQGFGVSSLAGGAAAARTISGLSEVDARFTVPFDLSGREGRELTDVCEAAGVAGLYSYKPATGMFKKLLGAEEAPAWIDPSVGSSYEQVLDSKGWGFLAEDKSEPHFAFKLMDTAPWERAREERAREEGDRSPVSSLGYCLRRLTDEEVEAAAAVLTPGQRHVLLEGGTDAPDVPTQEDGSAIGNGIKVDGGDVGTEPGRDEDGVGVYACALGGLPLFLSEDELRPPPTLGGTTSAWPGFRRPVHPDHVIFREESGPLRRTEVLCARSGAHLGHVFDDGPPPTGKRFCINRSALRFLSAGSPLPRESRPIRRPAASSLEALGTFGETLRDLELEAATFGGGCFWHVRDDFMAVPGVHDASCGFCGQIEAVRVRFDPAVTPYSDLVRRFFEMHDPTTGNRQGNDWGPQYQAAIFPHGDSQKQSADRIIDWARIMLHRASSGADKDNGAGVGGAGGASGSVVGAGAVAPAWWEGVEGQVMTLVIPTKHEDFTPEESPGERPS